MLGGTPECVSNIFGQLAAVFRPERSHQCGYLAVLTQQERPQPVHDILEGVLKALTVRGVHVAGINPRCPLVDD